MSLAYPFHVCRILMYLGVLGIAADATAWGQSPFGGTPRYKQPTLLAPDVINNLPDGADSPSISGDGLTIYYTGYPDLSKRATLWQATRPSLEADWETSEQLSHVVHAYARQLEPDVTSDGLELYFRATDRIANYDWWTDDDILVVSTRTSTDEEWGVPTPLPDIINESFPCVAWPEITGDGLELYFGAAEPYEGDRCGGRSSSIYVSRRLSREDPWLEPELVEPLAWIPGISPDGLRLYFSDGERDGTDLFVPTLFPGAHSLLLRTRASRDEEFGDTIELGNPPNTADQFPAISPDVSTDGQTIYFGAERAGPPSGWGIWQTSPAEPCDINGDGVCDVDDLARRSLFRRVLDDGSERRLDIMQYDISGDGIVNTDDLTTWLSAAAATNGFASAYFPGDANLDGEVRFDDFLALSAGFGGISRNWVDGNFNGDGEVGFADFLLLSANFGSTLPPANAAAVPEPNGCVLGFLGSIVLLSRRRYAVRHEVT